MKKLCRIQDADIRGKIVLVRVDHNVVKKGKIKDPYRIDASLPTLRYILDKGGKLVIMTHVGRPRNKDTGEIVISEETAVKPIILYLSEKLGVTITGLDLPADSKKGILDLDIPATVQALKNGTIKAVYLPNTRWFAGEETKDAQAEKLARQFAAIADIFVNDAFGSWQPHTSTIGPVTHIPSYAGFLMQKEIANIDTVLEPKRPFLAIIAGAKFDTKIGPISALLPLVDHLILGGVIYNAYLAAKYNIQIKGVAPEDASIAHDFVIQTEKYPNRIIELERIIESDLLEEKKEGSYRELQISQLKQKHSVNYILDIATASFQEKEITSTLISARTIFINAVMGYTPNFPDGTKALYQRLDENKNSLKLYGGGDTLQELRTLLPEIYQKAVQDETYYFFTGGGAVLKAIEQNSAYGMKPVEVLLKRNR